MNMQLDCMHTVATTCAFLGCYNSKYLRTLHLRAQFSESLFTFGSLFPLYTIVASTS